MKKSNINDYKECFEEQQERIEFKIEFLILNPNQFYWLLLFDFLPILLVFQFILSIQK